MKALVLLAAALPALAQRATPIDFHCTEDDLQALGQDCTESEPCPVYLELSQLEAIGPHLFITGNLHTQSSTIASILLASADGGRTWTEPHERMRQSALDQIQFIDFEVGWIAGHKMFGLPKDPFLLTTLDGGKTWTVKPVFEESGPGTIEQFWFESKTAGTLLIDRMQASETGVRHERYETMTGGENWSLMEAKANVIQVKRPVAASAETGWRLRADGPSKSYRVEHQESGRWVGVATFAVRAGDCRPEPTPPATPGKPQSDPPKPLS